MAVAYVGQRFSAAVTLSTTGRLSVSPNQTVPAGRLLILIVGDGSNTGLSAASNANDSQNNVWHVDAVLRVGTPAIYICSCVLATALTATDTITLLSGTTNVSTCVLLQEFSGVNTPDTVRTVGTSSGTATSSVGSAVISAQTGDLAVGAFLVVNIARAETPNDGSTQFAGQPLNGAGIAQLTGQFFTVGGPGLTNTTGTLPGNSDYVSVFVLYKSDPGTGRPEVYSPPSLLTR